MTLNMLRKSRVNHKISAYTYMFGEFNFNSTPVALPGTKVLAHVVPEERLTWDPNGEEGWYVGPAMDHYRCITIYFPQKNSTRACSTVDFFLTPFLFLKLN